MRKQSNLNPTMHKQSKPNIRKQFCVICSHEKEEQKPVDCIDLVCLPCRDKGHTFNNVLEGVNKITNGEVKVKQKLVKNDTYFKAKRALENKKRYEKAKKLSKEKCISCGLSREGRNNKYCNSCKSYEYYKVKNKSRLIRSGSLEIKECNTENCTEKRRRRNARLCEECFTKSQETSKEKTRIRNKKNRLLKNINTK